MKSNTVDRCRHSIPLVSGVSVRFDGTEYDAAVVVAETWRGSAAEGFAAPWEGVPMRDITTSARRGLICCYDGRFGSLSPAIIGPHDKPARHLWLKVALARARQMRYLGL